MEWLCLAKCLLQTDNPISHLSDNDRAKTILIPIPSKSSEKDHAYLFAQALSDLHGVRLEAEILQAMGAKSQKEKNILARKEVQISLNKSSTFVQGLNREEKAKINIIVVDDIFTTGATVRAAVRSLQGCGFTCAQISIITLATRADSCGF